MKKKSLLSLCLSATLVFQAFCSVPVVKQTKTEGTSKAASKISAASMSVEEAKQLTSAKDRFKWLYATMKDKDTGYFDENGIPYHSIEKLMIEAPDYGHESTSEAASYLMWLEAANGRMSGDYSGIDSAWNVINKYFIPTEDLQPSGGYNASSPATYADEYEVPSKYPSELKKSPQAGNDPIYSELKASYNTDTVYGMHWLVDVDNFYGFGGLDNSDPVYINTFQRGKMEGCWNTIPQPSWEDFSYGGPSGFLPYFTKDASYSQQWRYTIASDADARVVQAMYRAKEWAEEAGKTISNSSIENTKKLGDYLRYSMYDKYFMEVGKQNATSGQGKNSCMYLLSWYYAWGGDVKGQWSWKIGSSHSHFGYQHPFAAWVLSEKETGFVPKSATAQEDWSKSFDRQLELYQWLQSDEGGIAGGCTNSYNGRYEAYPAGTGTFYGMAYQEHPVYSNPGSNQWFGMQCWSMQRMSEVYYETGDERAKKLMDKWVAWAESQLKMDSPDEYLPGNLSWSGQPGTWDENKKTSDNSGLHVKVTSWGHDVGISASLANTLLYYAAAQRKYGVDGYESHVEIAEALLDKIWTYVDEKGLGDVSTWDADKIALFYNGYEESPDGSVVKGVYVPKDYADGVMPYGDAIKPGSSFYDIRANAFAAEVKRENAEGMDENTYNSLAYSMANLEKGEAFDLTYHRFWANCDAAIALCVLDEFFPNGANSGGDTTTQGGNDNTTQNGGNDNTTQNGGNDNTTQNGGNDNTTQNGGNDNTTQNGGNDNTTQNGGNNTTQSGGNDNTTQNGGNDNTTQSGGNDNTTQNGGNDNTTQSGGNDNTTQNGGNDNTTQNGGNDNTTQNGGNDNTTQNGGNNTTQSGGNNTTQSGGNNTTQSGGNNTTQNGGNNTTQNGPSDIEVENIYFTEPIVTMKVGDKKQLSVQIQPDNATNKSITWSINPAAADKAVIDANGYITALASGIVPVIAQTSNGKFASCTVYINDNGGNGNNTTQDNNNTTQGGNNTTQGGNNTTQGGNNTTQGGNNTTQSGNNTTQSGNNTTQSGNNTTQGNNNNTTQGNNNTTQSGNNTTQAPSTIPVEMVQISNNTLTVTVGNTKTLSAYVYPSNASNQNITWNSSDSNIASVSSNGTVTGIKAGSAIIFAICDGKVARCDVTVITSNSDNNTTQGGNNTTQGNNNNTTQGNNNNTTQSNNNNTTQSNNNNTTQSGNNNTTQSGNNNTTQNGSNTTQNGTGTTQAPNGNNNQTPTGPVENPLEPTVTDLGGNTYITNTTIIKGTIIKGSVLKYQITKNDATGKEASVYGLSKSASSISIPNMIVINNEVYKVTSVRTKAFYNKSVIKKITLGKNIKSIGSKAFYKCKKVKTVTIKTTKLTTKNVKSNAFGKMKAKMTIKVPKAKKAAYKKLLIKRGISKKATIK